MLLCSLSFSHKHKCTPTHYLFVSLSLSAPLSLSFCLSLSSLQLRLMYQPLCPAQNTAIKILELVIYFFLYVRRTGWRHPKKVTHKIT